MEQRIDYLKKGAEPLRVMYGLETYLAKCSLEKQLLHLIKYRVSQINGCALCLDIHSKDLRAGGETEQRIYCLDAWRETDFYTSRERAALAWAEAVTLITVGHVPDAVYGEARKEFSEEELVDLNVAVAAINAWNRFAIPFRAIPGAYQPATHAATK